MVLSDALVSILDKSIRYPEIKTLENDDTDYTASIYEINLHNEDIIVALGQAKYNYIENNIVYFPIYIIKNDKVQSRIGVYELFADDLPNILDEEGDINLELINPPLLFSFINKAFINKNVSSNLELEDEESDENELEYSPLQMQTEEQALRETDKFKSTKEDNWFESYMKNNNYKFVKNEGQGDCLFASIRDGLNKIDAKLSVSELRKMLADNTPVATFEGYKMQYELIVSEINALNKEIKELLNKHKGLKTKMKETKSRAEQEKIVLLADEVGVRHKNVKVEHQQANDLLKEFKFMKGINTFKKFLSALQTCDFWADTVAISTLERVLNKKLIIFSKDAYDSGDVDNVLQCGQLNDNILENAGIFEPSHYILVNYIGEAHYELITYKKRGALTFNELPFNIKELIKYKCLEKQSGPYYLIPEFKSMHYNNTGIATQLKEINIVNPTSNEPEPIVEFEKSSNDIQPNDYESYAKTLDAKTLGVDDASELYDNNAIFQFYSKSDDKPKPGKGSGEKIISDGIQSYNELAGIPQWRRKLSNFWIESFIIDGKKWNSVEHYYQGSKFKKQNPEFYYQFSLDSKSHISVDPLIAKRAGGKTGKIKSELIRPKNIKIDEDFFSSKRDEKEMEEAMKAKFTQNDDLKKLLRATKKAKLVHFSRGAPAIPFYNLMRIRKVIQINE